MEYERKHDTDRERNEGFIRELILKDRIDRLWEYYSRRDLEVSGHSCRRRDEVSENRPAEAGNRPDCIQ